MKRSHLAWLAVLALVALGVAIAIPWAVIGLTVYGNLAMNGAWLLVLICFASALAMIFQARRAELEEEREERYAAEAEDV